MTNQFFQYVIEVDPTGYWYRLFYQLAVLAAFLVFLSYGYIKKFPITKWLLLTTTATFCGILGSKLGTYGFAEWQEVWETGALLSNTNRTSIGAFVLGLSGIFLTIRLLGLPKESFDVYAYLIPVVVIFQRIGCLMGACCFGTPTNGNWGLQYEGVSLIRDHHINSGLVTQLEATSCLVHPVPVYFILAGMLTLLLVYKMRHLIKVAGNLTLFSVGAILLSRFIIEFFRDGITNHQMGDLYVGMKGVEWFLLVMVVVLFLVVVLRERRNWNWNFARVIGYLFSKKKNNTSASPPRTVYVSGRLRASAPPCSNPAFAHTLKRSGSGSGSGNGNKTLLPSVIFATAITLLILLSRNAFTQVEIAIMHAKLILLWLTVAYFLIAQIQFRRIRWQVLTMALLSFAMMSQTYPETNEELNANANANLNEDDLSGKKDISINVNFNELDVGEPQFECLATEQGCFGDVCSQYDVLPIGPTYFTGNAGIDVIDYYEYSEKRHNKYTRYGVTYQPEIFYNKEAGHTEKKYSVMPYWGFGNTKIFETRVGLRVGNMYGGNFRKLDNTKKTQLTFDQRFGDINAFYLKFSYLNAPDVGPSANRWNSSVNYKFGDKAGPLDHISLGTSGINESSRNSRSTWYLETTFLMYDHWTITPRFGVIGLPTGNDVDPYFYYGIGAGYRFRTGE